MCRGLDGLALQAPAFPLRHAAPDAEPLIVLQGVLQALGPDLAAPAHSLSLPGRSSLFREERLRICLRAQGPVLPAQLVDIIRANEHVRQRDDDLSHSASSLPTRGPLPTAPHGVRITSMKLHSRVLLQVKPGR